MLIKITLILLVISTALLIIARVYFKTLSTSDKLRLLVRKNYKTGEEILLMIIGFTYMITFVMVVVTIINLILRCL